MNLHKRILEATKNLHGWCSDAKAISLANMVLALRPSTIVEIGVWGGKSLIPMALASDNALIYAVDAWSAEESKKGQSAEDEKWWGEQQHESVYQDFMANLEKHNLQSRVFVWRVPSDQFNPPDRIELLHIDGNHGPQAEKDTIHFAPNIPSGGICVLDDLHWTGGNVGKAAEWLKANGFIELHPLGTGAVFFKL